MLSSMTKMFVVICNRTSKKQEWLKNSSISAIVFIFAFLIVNTRVSDSVVNMMINDISVKLLLLLITVMLIKNAY